MPRRSRSRPPHRSPRTQRRVRLVAVELGLLLVDALTHPRNVRVPVVLDLLPAAAGAVRGLFGLRLQLGRLLVARLRASSTLDCKLGLAL